MGEIFGMVRDSPHFGIKASYPAGVNHEVHFSEFRQSATHKIA
jgi:hypothetical protein